MQDIYALTRREREAFLRQARRLSNLPKGMDRQRAFEQWLTALSVYFRAMDKTVYTALSLLLPNRREAYTCHREQGILLKQLEPLRRRNTAQPWNRSFAEARQALSQHFRKEETLLATGHSYFSAGDEHALALGLVIQQEKERLAAADWH